MFQTLAALRRLPNLQLTVKANVVRACVHSVLGYGTEGSYVPEACLKQIEKLNILQRRTARMLLQTPQSTANEACTLDLGWETIQTHLDIRLIRYR